jgi:hypothetical protein
MKVKCCINTLQKAKENNILNDDILYCFKRDFNEPLLRLNDEYKVYGILLTSKGIWVFILEDFDDEFPKHYPLSFFEIIDSNIPENWILGKGHNFEYGSRKVFGLLSHPVWVEDESFYEDLTNSNPIAIKKFQANY